MNAANIHQIQNALSNVIERLVRIEAMLREVIDTDGSMKSGASPWDDGEILDDAEDAA